MSFRSNYLPFIIYFVLLSLQQSAFANTEQELQAAREEIQRLTARLNVYELAGIPDEADNLNAQAVNSEVSNQASNNKAYEELQKQHQNSRLKIGELQAELTELRKRLGQDNNDNTLLNENQALKLEKRKLLRKLDELGVLIDLEQEADFELKETPMSFFIAGIICIVIGMLLGMYIYDYRNRRKHGGFRL